MTRIQGCKEAENFQRISENFPGFLEAFGKIWKVSGNLPERVLMKYIRHDDSYLYLSVWCLCGLSEMALLCRMEGYQQHQSRSLHFCYWCLMATPVCLRGAVNVLTERERERDHEAHCEGLLLLREKESDGRGRSTIYFMTFPAFLL